MSPGSIAKRYAKALLELAQGSDTTQNNTDQAIDTLLGFSQQIIAVKTLFEESDELQGFLLDPKNTKTSKLKVVASILEKMELHPLVRNFVALITSKGRIALFGAIADAFVALANEAAQRCVARVVLAAPPQAELEKALQEKLSQLTKKQVQLDIVVDPSIIGGAITFVESFQIDGSLRNHLNQIRQSIA